jgi:hypothetical protein
MPRPSRRDPYTFPADAKIPEEGTYAEPDPNAGRLFNTMGNPASPPPLPDSQPPGSPPPVNFNRFPGGGFPKTEFTGEPPPKPERTLLRKEKERKTSMNEPPPPPPSNLPATLPFPAGPEESYDHINTGRKWKASDRDRQNNIINGENGGPQEMNVYSHLDNNDYSHAVFTPKTTPVKDNVYDTTAKV